MRIVVVDDETVVLSLVRDALEDDGYDVSTFADSRDALKFLSGHPVDLLLTDIRMPGLNGIELVKQARAINPELSVIFMTGYANLNSAKDAIKQGASDYIMKPFELSEIRHAVKQALVQKAESVARTTDQELRKLSDLSNMLVMSGDMDSIIASTINFAVVHQQAEAGAILICRTDEAMLISVDSGGVNAEKVELPSGSLMRSMETARQYGSSAPCLYARLTEHPFWQSIEIDTILQSAQPKWAKTCEHLLITPVSLAERSFGYLVLGYSDDSIRVRNADFKFISFTARQLAVTLENLYLLKETQHAYDRLRELQEMTIDLEKLASRGEMASEIGHELNNFLGVIAGNLSLIQLHVQKQNYQALEKHCTTIMKTIEKMTSFTENLMSASSATSTLEPIMIDKLLKEVFDYLHPQKRFKGIRLDLQIDKADISIMANTTQFQQLLYNLFNNAADACAGRSKNIISARLANLGEQRCELTIQDNGCGFDTTNLQKAFSERFTTKPTGHGLGLIVCNRIIANHGGTFTVDSETGKGTTIRMEFPLVLQRTAATVRA